MFKPESIKKWDNKLTFVVGYRNLYNIVVTFIAGVYLTMSGTQSGIQAFAGIILFVMGMKWFLSQCRENLDSMFIEDTYGNKPRDRVE